MTELQEIAADIAHRRWPVFATADMEIQSDLIEAVLEETDSDEGALLRLLARYEGTV